MWTVWTSTTDYILESFLFKIATKTNWAEEAQKGLELRKFYLSQAKI